jgi:hypothetical protein
MVGQASSLSIRDDGQSRETRDHPSCNLSFASTKDRFVPRLAGHAITMSGGSQLKDQPGR